jgi:DNA-binding MurR/RpiR family transcriptional regulator
MAVADRIEGGQARLTPAERRVADVVLRRPQSVAFGTVAEVATAAGASGATVVRLAGKLGYDGFTGMQSDVQEELRRRLRPATERIRQAPPSDLLGRALAAELQNVESTFEAVDRRAFEAAVRVLADRRRQVRVLAGDASRAVGAVLADNLSLLRDGVATLEGADVQVARALAVLGAGDVVVAVDHRRYERWVVTTAARAAERGVDVVALTDSPLSPLAELARHTFVVAAAGVGPFDSHVGTLALTNALVAGVAARLRESATRRLDAVEEAWRAADVLVD